MVAKAEYLDKGENLRFAVTSPGAEQWAARDLYEKFYCARGEMENRIKEQICLFACRLSTEQMKGNQLRLYLSALAYTLVEALRRRMGPGPGRYHPAKAVQDRRRDPHQRPPRAPGTQFHLSLEASLHSGLPRPAHLNPATPLNPAFSTLVASSAGGAMPETQRLLATPRDSRHRTPEDPPEQTTQTAKTTPKTRSAPCPQPKTAPREKCGLEENDVS